MPDFHDPDPMDTRRPPKVKNASAEEPTEAPNDEVEVTTVSTGEAVGVNEPPAARPKGMVGRYAQRTFRLPPQYLELIRQIAENEIMSIADAERWVVGRGLLAYFGDEERPRFARSVQRRVVLPWSEDE